MGGTTDIRDLGHIEHHREMTQLLKALTLYSGNLINFSELGGKLELHRTTVKKYTNLLEQLFLVEYLPPWHCNDYKRLIKTPKIHITDTGIICAARGINAHKLTANPDILGSVLETFVFNELRKQSNFINEKLKFYHYRDKDNVEVDIVIENNSDELIGIEVKATASIKQSDLVGLKKLEEIANKKFKIGILLYDGDHTTSFGDKLFAVPIASLWS